jgi:hypothetical protein
MSDKIFGCAVICITFAISSTVGLALSTWAVGQTYPEEWLTCKGAVLLTGPAADKYRAELKARVDEECNEMEYLTRR